MMQQASSALEKKGIVLNELVPLHLDSTAEETYGRSPTHRSSSAGEQMVAQPFGGLTLTFILTNTNNRTLLEIVSASAI